MAFLVHQYRGLDPAQAAIQLEPLDLDRGRIGQFVPELLEQFFPQQLRRQYPFVDRGQFVGLMKRGPFRQQPHDRIQQVFHLRALCG
ncbi:hypothetical protein D3C83_96860 [compost metagenome]